MLNYQFVLAVIVGYLIGSLSIARIVTGIVRPGTKLEDVQMRDATTGGTFTLKTVGATTASMLLGPKLGGMIGMLDIVKAALPALITRLLFPDQPYYLLIGLGVVIGHIWPLYYHFHGGGGLSPVLGTLLVLDPLGTLVCVLVAFVIGMFVLKEISFTVMGGPMLYILWAIAFQKGWMVIAIVVLLNALLIFAVLPDIRRHLQGTREGKTDLSNSMDSLPMGQMMKKMMIKMGLEKHIKR